MILKGCFRGQGGHGGRTARVGSAYSVSGISCIARFFSKVSSEMFSGIWIRNLTDWCGSSSSTGMISLEECLGVIDCVIKIIQKILVRYRNVDELIIIRALNLLPDFLHLEVHCLRVKG